MASAPEITEELSDRVRTPEPRILRLVTDTSRKEKVPVCIYGKAYGTHDTHLAYMNGEWIEKPTHLDHRTQGKIETCPECEEHYNNIRDHGTARCSYGWVALAHSAGRS